MAQDHFKERNEYELLAGYYSPVSDAYMKEGLAKAKHRVKMCTLAVETTSDWLMVDSWEPRQTTYQRTAVVLDHFDHELNVVGGGIRTKSGKCQLNSITTTSRLISYELGEQRKIRIMLLAGGDLIASFGHPGVWAPKDVSYIHENVEMELNGVCYYSSYITLWVIMDLLLLKGRAQTYLDSCYRTIFFISIE